MYFVPVFGRRLKERRPNAKVVEKFVAIHSTNSKIPSNLSVSRKAIPRLEQALRAKDQQVSQLQSRGNEVEQELLSGMISRCTMFFSIRSYPHQMQLRRDIPK